MPRVEKTINVQAPVERCYQLWSRFEDFPRFMEDIKEIRQTGPDQYHWIAEAPMGQQYEWDARVTERQENRTISWESTSGVGNSGAVRFEPADGGCRMHVSMELYPPGGAVGEVAAQATQDVERRVETALREFKRIAEGAGVGTEGRIPYQGGGERP